ncbi:MAG: hypothetical protein ACTSXJ_09760, partial [Candidatus Baldrarchaeia archaeon]
FIAILSLFFSAVIVDIILNASALDNFEKYRPLLVLSRYTSCSLVPYRCTLRTCVMMPLRILLALMYFL